MTRDERLVAVRSLVAAARRVVERRAGLVPQIAAHTGLSEAGVELGFTRHLELAPRDAEIDRLLDGVRGATRVHVVLSANVFVAPLRALVLARAAAPHVTVHPSKRDPTFARALVAEAADPGLSLEESLDVADVAKGEIQVYGRDATIASVQARARAGVVVRGHGPGMGVALVSRESEVVEAAEALVRDVVAFDQRGCLSPRVVLSEGGTARARALAAALDAALSSWARSVPRGTLAPDEATEAARYVEAMAFAGEAWRTEDHAVAAAPEDVPLVVPPAGRHVHVAPFSSVAAASRLLAPHRGAVVAVGTDAAARFADAIPGHARVSPLGEMQRPPLDGPVDLRAT